MSVSKRKREANRKNAKKSTGPKSKQGKEIASKNAVKHGLYSDDIVIKSNNFSEDADEYEELVSSLFNALLPVDKLQEHLVTKIANCMWRSQRVIRAETAYINAQMDEVQHDIETAELYKKLDQPSSEQDDCRLTDEERERVLETSLGKRSIISGDTGHYILRMEMRLDRQLTRAYQMLRQLQAIPKNPRQGAC